MANYTVGRIELDIKIEDTFVVVLKNGEKTWEYVTEVKTDNSSQVTELSLQRKYEDMWGTFKWANFSSWDGSAVTTGLFIPQKIKGSIKRIN